MQIDPRLNEVDDSLYRVAVRALVFQNDKLLVVKEVDGDDWWAIPGGGVDYGETLEASLLREINEELGISATSVVCDFQIAHYNIGKIVNGIPRMNVFFKVSVPEDEIKKTEHVETWSWITKDEFRNLELNPSYEKAKLSKIVFS